jgi:hypothetical protein
LDAIQLAFLRRGPSYVAPCQLHLELAGKDRLEKQWAPLQQQLNQVFRHYSAHLGRQLQFKNDLKQTFQQCFGAPLLPTRVEVRARAEQRLIESLRQHLREQPYLLRRSANGENIYHLCARVDFQQQTKEFMTDTDLFERIIDIESKTLVTQLRDRLETLHQNKCLPKEYLTRICPSNKSSIRLPRLSFLPLLDSTDHSFTVQPHCSSFVDTPIAWLAQFLDELLKPWYQRASQSTTVEHGPDLIKKLEHYTQQAPRFTASTSFVSFSFTDLAEHVQHDDLLDALNQFLRSVWVIHRQHRLTIDTIVTLTSLVLQYQVVSYRGQLYRYRQGCSLKHRLGRILLNIFLYQWQTGLVRQVRLDDQYYARCEQHGLFTWDGTPTRVHELFHEWNQAHPYLNCALAIGNRVELMQMEIENCRGYLVTRYARTSMSPWMFNLPFVKDHPRLQHRRWLRYRLMQAAQYCSSFDDFEQQRRYLECTFLTNGYSLEFVHSLVEQFFVRFAGNHLRIGHHPLAYQAFRRNVFAQTMATTSSSVVPRPRIIQLPYLFDWGSRCQFHRQFYELWSTLCREDTMLNKASLTVQLCSRHCSTSHALLLRLS